MTTLTEEENALLDEVADKIRDNLRNTMSNMWQTWSQLGVNEEAKVNGINKLLETEMELHSDVSKKVQQELELAVVQGQVENLKNLHLTGYTLQIYLGLLAVAAAYPGIIHSEGPQFEEKYDHHDLIGETGHHHHVEHEHAKSHQSIKFEHFHPVPVYVKKEHSHLLKHPLEKGKSEQNLKQIHPETEHKHGGGFVLEDHRYSTDQHLAGLEHGGFEHGGFEGFEQGGQEHGGYEHLAGGFEGYEGGESLKGYAELQPESHGYYFTPSHGGGESGEGYKHESY